MESMVTLSTRSVKSGARPKGEASAKPSRRRNKQEISNSAIGSDSQTIGLENDALSTIIVAQPVART